jgi:hypothetical protein
MLPKEDAKSTEDEFVKFIQKAVKWISSRLTWTK